MKRTKLSLRRGGRRFTQGRVREPRDLRMARVFLVDSDVGIDPDVAREKEDLATDGPRTYPPKRPLVWAVCSWPPN
ncbi:unnamed protein product [Linum trigynum]|uniref:Uncharacterized protein n=1 Tax=Linum trigynum TaxID=586398 RepID=A0AAV2E7I7_9ROSI